MSVPGNQQQEIILIVDDDRQLQQLLTRYLTEQGYVASAVGDGDAMDHWLELHQPDLIILDLMLPGEDGLSLARRIRHRAATPIIILSARGEELDKIIGLEVGADDYLSKPFNPRELLARIRAVLRRGGPAVSTLIEDSEKNSTTETRQQEAPQQLTHFGEFTLNLETRILWRNGAEVELTSGETALLIILLSHPNRVLSREQLMDMMNAGEVDSFDRSIDVRITRLRRKLDDSSAKPRFIRTVWGEGYRFTPDPVSNT
ncbi:MAG: two-component system response regulator OmpR [Gammaproteobacteria bacterium]|nr:MAG: two-component system response regulator OmpR [Gammaproteobacteria bacterium]